MTYCVGLLVERGLVFMSDTRTNAGLDNISVVSKMKTWEVPGERFLCLLSAGNLATTQATVSLLDERKLAPLVRDYPSVSLINIDAILTRVQELIAQVSRAVELILGLVLFAPRCTYPAHSHDSISESYLCLSGAVSEGDTGVYAPGSLLFTPPNRPHRITTGDFEPTLLSYAWTGTPEKLQSQKMSFTRKRRSTGNPASPRSNDA